MFVIFLVTVFLSVEVNSQVCVNETYVTKMVPRSYEYGDTVIQEYEKEKILMSFEYCCDGYIRDYSWNYGNITCKPICEPACENGYCKYPGNCKCNSGYTIDEQNNHTCVSFCEKGCGNGTCIAPNTCRCDHGYKFENGTCQPVCTDCRNGICVSPGKCDCLPGYSVFLRDFCEPHCSKGCVSGRCISPEKCQCFAGYVLAENTHPNRCVIQCSLLYNYNMCGQGTCEASNLCRCFPGYKPDYTRTRSYRDVPICVPMPICADCKESADCVLSPKCVRKDDPITIRRDTTSTTFRMTSTTESSTAYTTRKTSVIRPSETNINNNELVRCNLLVNPCGNGTCLFPNQCRCFQGYRVNYNALWGYIKGPVCVPACNNCYGSTCVAPNKCIKKEDTVITKDTTRTQLETSKRETTKSSTTYETTPKYKTTTSLSFSSEITVTDKTLRNCNQNPCGNGTCVSSNRCDCFNGYVVNYLRLWGYDHGPVCVPTCTDCERSYCIAPNKCMATFTTTDEDTTRITSEISKGTKLTTVYKPSTTSVPTTDTNKNYESENESTTEYNFVTNNSLKAEVRKGETMQISWMQQHKMSILIPILVVITAGIIMSLVWKRTRILNIFQRKTYTIQGDAPNYNGCHKFQKIQFLPNGNQQSVEITQITE